MKRPAPLGSIVVSLDSMSQVGHGIDDNRDAMSGARCPCLRVVVAARCGHNADAEPDCLSGVTGQRFSSPTLVQPTNGSANLCIGLARVSADPACSLKFTALHFCDANCGRFAANGGLRPWPGKRSERPRSTLSRPLPKSRGNDITGGWKVAAGAVCLNLWPHPDTRTLTITTNDKANLAERHRRQATRPGFRPSFAVTGCS